MIITVDFETKPIDGNTSFNPPEPVGVSIKKDGDKSKYWAWGHPTNNNCTRDEAKTALADIWGKPIIYHNAKFDVSVALAWLDLPMPDPKTIHDTMYLLFLDNPYSDNLSLKPNSERLLNLPPEEQDAVQNWVMANTSCRTRKEAGAWIYTAPGDLVGKYAESDTDRTYGLYKLLEPQIKNNDMWEAYEREQLLMPITYYSEKKGVRVDRDKLMPDLIEYEAALIKCESKLREKLKADVDFNKGKEIAEALQTAGVVKEEDWLLTPTGKISTSKASLEHAISKSDVSVLHLLNYRGSMASALQTFARPWDTLSEYDGRIHTTWNQVRTHDRDSKDSRGSRTGRLSGSKPSLMNVTNEIKIKIPDGLPPPPLMREYLLPEEGHMWLKRDFSGQEIRVLAHFEDGELMFAYQEDAGLDPHEMAKQMIHEITGKLFERKDIKITAFSIIYGSGVRGIAQQLNKSEAEAKEIKEGYLKAFPGVSKLQKLTSARGKAGKDIRTWGGRMYLKEPSKLIKNRKIDFSYKLLNYLIQGSSADQTKQCIIDWDNNKPQDNVFMATVHDEINISAPIETWEHDMSVLRKYMNQDLFDAPMQSEGFYGPNWYDITECK
jgi:DNA polymerase-1